HLTDAGLEAVPVRPHEGLVVEAGGQEAPEAVEEGVAIALRIGPAVDRTHLHARFQGDHGRAGVGLGGAAQANVENGVGLVRAGAPDAAWPVVLEAAADEAHAVGQQCGCDRVPRLPLQGASIEGEVEALGRGPCPDPARAHAFSPRSARVAKTSWVTVWRSIRKNSPQVRCSQISREGPLLLDSP